MVEKITVNPESIRAYGNIITPKNANDFTSSSEDYKVVKTTDTVYGAETNVFGLDSAYDLTFNSESYTTSTGSLDVQVTLKKDGAIQFDQTITVTGGGGGTGTGNTDFTGVAAITVTGITESGTLTATYKNAQATATVTYEQSSYSLAFSQDTYTVDMLGNASVSCTLKQSNTPMSGETITFTYDNFGLPISVTATTNSSGVATYTFNEYDFPLLPATVTATYSGATATCTIENGGGII